MKDLAGHIVELGVQSRAPVSSASAVALDRQEQLEIALEELFGRLRKSELEPMFEDTTKCLERTGIVNVMANASETCGASKMRPPLPHDRTHQHSGPNCPLCIMGRMHNCRRSG